MVYCDFCNKKNLKYFYRIKANGSVLRFACSDCKFIFDIILKEHIRKNLDAIAKMWRFLADPYYGDRKINIEKGKRNW